MTTDIIPHSGAEAFRASTDAANLCKQIVVATAKPIKGRRFVGVEGWQAIALAHGCVASSGDVERTETGFRAIGRVVRMNDGMVISTAEGFVGDDETAWAVRPEYARRAMAQTRSISRACRSAFAHVVVMMQAGLETTPAEEMTIEGETVEAVTKAGPSEEPKVTDVDRDAIHTALSQHDVTLDELLNRTGHKRLQDAPSTETARMIAWIQKYGAAKKGKGAKNKNPVADIKDDLPAGMKAL